MSVISPALLNTHISAGLLHFVQACYAFGLSIARSDETPNFALKFKDHVYAKYKLAFLAGVFPLLSTFNHGLSVFNRTKYADIVEQGYNPWRWTEYSVSAGVMLLLIAQLSDVVDLPTLLVIVSLNAVIQYLGYTSEKLSRDPATKPIAFRDFWMGAVLFVLAWYPIFHSFAYAISSSDRTPPDIVYIIIFVMAALFSSFAWVAYKYIQGSITSFARTEMFYALLSLVSKSLLTNLTLFGVLFRPQDTIDYL